MLESKFQDKFKVKTYDSCFTRKISPKGILGYMEEVATSHAEKLGVGYDESYKNGYIWILRSAKYVFSQLPKLDDVVVVTTWPSGMDGVKALRRFSFKIENKVIGEGFNYWLMYDINRKRPIYSPYFKEVMENIEILNEDYFTLKKISTQSDMHLAYQKVILNSDLDWNNHVNNVNYADIIFNAIPYEVIKRYDIISMQIDYLQECRKDEMIQVFIKEELGNYFVEGRYENIVKFRSYIEIKKD